jgi:HipA-like protein
VEPPPPEAVAEFLLKYDDLIVGKLTAKRGKWHFEYSVEFKKNKKLRPILELPDIEKHYESPILWQFFAMRIPSLEQPEIEEILSKESIDEHNSVKLLERFGRRTIANPYDLELVS